ncbi:vitamin K epoxide reductase family protein [Prochlorococcus marinus]|uniref:vitamin K epoxide reductase family protein n=1 Tax=Prochlorococcus marinus TaxID=1219 RepID=UPI0022B32AED|nr:vitamin K epoxide reductase family protein [Prochlorococcus marinus]
MGKTRLKSRRRQDQGSKLAKILIGILATIGVIDTASITLTRWGVITSLACPGNAQGCDQVLNSPWGTIFELNNFSVPLSFIGFLGYSTVLILSIIPFFPWLTREKIDFSRIAWWSLFCISTCMTAFSFLLMGIMVIQIKALCFFCILSALISSFILLLTIIGGGWEERRDLIVRGVIISLIVLLGGLIWSSSVNPNKTEVSINSQGVSPQVESKSKPASIELAKYLTEKNIILYNAYWCPHCHEQKELFGNEATKSLILIECAQDGKNNKFELCQSKFITSFPSWEINGQIITGVKSLNELANMSGYSGSRDF